MDEAVAAFDDEKERERAQLLATEAANADSEWKVVTSKRGAS